MHRFEANLSMVLKSTELPDPADIDFATVDFMSLVFLATSFHTNQQAALDQPQAPLSITPEQLLVLATNQEQIASLQARNQQLQMQQLQNDQQQLL